MNLRNYSSAGKRRSALAQALSVDLTNTGSFTLDENAAGSKNCENMIGATQIPVGVAGPLAFTSISGRKAECYLPLATTEGALVASVNRGCKAITESGGAMVDSYKVGATRGPVFKVNNLEESNRLNKFLDVRFEELQSVAAKTSGHLALKKYMDRGVGRYRYIRFVFDTQDAMGLNMVTIATNAVVDYITKKTGIPCLALAGNYDVDKKSSWLNSIEGRGIKVWAEVTLSKRVLEAVLKTTAQKIYEVWLAKCMLGSAMSGSMGFNAQYANIVAAISIATGQDPAHVVEGAVGITTAEVVNSHDVYVSVYMPDLMVGTVGGGTGLATQKEALSIIGATSSQQLAEVTGAAALAGEISLLSSLAQGTLAKAHIRLARGK